MFWTIMGIVVPAGICVYCAAMVIKNVAKLFGK